MFVSAVEAVRSFASQARRRDASMAGPTGKAASTLACPICDCAMKVRETLALDTRSGSDFCLHALRCDTCGMVADRLYHPVSGYDPGVPV